MRVRGRGEDLSRPRRERRGLGIHYDTDAFGQFSEAIARFLGGYEGPGRSPDRRGVKDGALWYQQDDQGGTLSS